MCNSSLSWELAVNVGLERPSGGSCCLLPNIPRPQDVPNGPRGGLRSSEWGQEFQRRRRGGYKQYIKKPMLSYFRQSE